MTGMDQYTTLEDRRRASIRLRQGDPLMSESLPSHYTYTRQDNWSQLTFNRNGGSIPCGEFPSVRDAKEFCEHRGFTVRRRYALGVVRFFHPDTAPMLMSTADEAAA